MTPRLLLASLFLSAASLHAQENRLLSPEVRDGKATFRLQAPQAAEVAVGGNFTEKKVPMIKNERGQWELTVGPLAPDVYVYWFEMGGERFPDPRNSQLKVGTSVSSLLIVPDVAKPRLWQDRVGLPHGTMHHHNYDSRVLNEERGYSVWTPPGYDAARAKPYPVLYLLHGSGDDEYGWPAIGRSGQIAESLLAAGQMEPMLIVMPRGMVRPSGEVPADMGERRKLLLGLFAKTLLEEIIPAIEHDYHAAHDREHRAVAGLSMGGGQSAYVGLQHPELFPWVACFSGVVSSGEWQQTAEKDPNYAKQYRLFWLSCGDRETRLRELAETEFLPLFKKYGLPAEFTIVPGAHEWKVWRENLATILPKLFRPS